MFRETLPPTTNGLLWEWIPSLEITQCSFHYSLFLPLTTQMSGPGARVLLGCKADSDQKPAQD